VCAPMCPPISACGGDGDCFSRHCNMGKCM
jgi:hypothetical protein